MREDTEVMEVGVWVGFGLFFENEGGGGEEEIDDFLLLNLHFTPISMTDWD